MPLEKHLQVLLLVWIFYILDVAVAQRSDCYPCQDYNKHNKTVDECTFTEEDCEGCLEGYEEYPWSPFIYCGSPGSVVIDQTGNVSLQYDTRAILKCHFETQGDCTWLFNDYHINNENLNYIIGSNGVNTTDCSIQLDVNWDNTGKWECQSVGDSTDDTIEGINVYITIKVFYCPFTQKANITEHPQNASATVGGTVSLPRHFDIAYFGSPGSVVIDQPGHVSLQYDTRTILKCHFGTQGDCAWLFNNYHINNENLNYIIGSNGVNTTDCSIQLDVNWDNTGKWECQSVRDSTDDTIEGINVYITIQANITEHPQNTSATVGGNVTLPCHFDIAISCIWLHNGTETNIVDRYRFLNGIGNGSDCTMQITKFKETDAGSWNCGCNSNSSLERTISNEAWLLTTVEDNKNGLAAGVIVVIVIITIVGLIILISAVLCWKYICIKNPSNGNNSPHVKYECGKAAVTL